MAKTPIIPPLPEEEHFEQELGAYNYIPNDEDDGTGENLMAMIIRPFLTTNRIVLFVRMQHERLP